MNRKQRKHAQKPVHATYSDTVNSTHPQRGNTPYFLAATIALITFLVYLPVLKNGFVLGWDDNAYVLNTYIRSLNLDFFRWAFTDTSAVGYWHPLTWISHAVDYAIWGLNPVGHHLTSIFLHAVNSGIVAVLSVRLLKIAHERTLMNDGLPYFDMKAVMVAGATTGLLFGVHPLHVESVAWVSQRKDLLYSLFYLLSIIWYLRFATHTTPKKSAHISYSLNGSFLVSLALFVLALCSKPMAVTLPAVLIILDWYPLKRIASWKNIPSLFVEKLPFFILSVTASLVTVFIQKFEGDLKSLEVATLTIRILVAFRSLMFYIWKAIAPVNLLPLYPYPKDASLAKPEYLAAIALVLLITIGCILAARTKRIWLAAWAFFIVTLLPVLGFLQAGMQSMADRYMYMSSIGVFFLVGTGIAYIWSRHGARDDSNHNVQWCIGAVMITITVSLSYTTVRQIPVWQNTISLWSYYIAKEPRNSPEVYFLRADEFRKIRQTDQAIKDYNAAIALDHRFLQAYFDRGETLLEAGRYDMALEDFNKAITLNPGFTDAYVGRGNAYYIKGDTKRAIEEFNTIIDQNPNTFKAYVSRGIVYKNSGDVDKAIDDFTRGLSLKPDLEKVYLARGDLYAKNGAIDRAMLDYKKACELGNETGCKKQIFPLVIPRTPQKP